MEGGDGGVEGAGKAILIVTATQALGLMSGQSPPQKVGPRGGEDESELYVKA